MRKAQISAAVLLLAVVGSRCQSSNRDCDIKQTEYAARQFYYYELKNLTWTTDEEKYVQRCNHQLDSADALMAYANRCVKSPRGLAFIKKIIRAGLYEVLQVCHANADPQKQEDFKKLTDCHNKIWPLITHCMDEWLWNAAEAARKPGVDVTRLCCSTFELHDCLAASGKNCPPEDQPHFNKVIMAYQGDAMGMLCNATHNCDALPPPDKTKAPQPAFTSFLKIANAL